MHSAGHWITLTHVVLGSHARQFKAVFDQANSELMDVFGMIMVELPRGDRVTARQKRGMSSTTDLLL